MARKARHVVGFDSEDDGDGHPFLWAFTHSEGSYHTRSQGDAQMFVANLADAQRARGRQVEAWATNLEYDLCNLFDSERVRELTLRFGRSALCGASWRGADFRDTIRHLPVSVADLGELIGLSKRHREMFERKGPQSFQVYLERCQRDATITFRAAKALHDTFEPFGSYPRMTLASTALAVWRDRFWKRKLYRPSRDVWHAAAGAYYGGRTEAFAVGTFVGVSAIDVASMFPWAMTQTLPLPWGMFERAHPGDRVAPLGLYYVTVRSELKRPRLPVRTSQGNVFPNGEWQGWYVGEELLAFARAGGRFRVIRGFRFLEVCDPFTGYVAAMFRRKSRARGVRRLLYKLMLNALYGKFGQKGKVVRALPVERFARLANAPTRWREWNGLVIYSTEGPPPIWSNNVWPAFVTARARVRLADEMDRLELAGARNLYCDTDSVLFQGGSVRYPDKAKRPGDFETRGEFDRALIIGRKEYALDTGGGKWQVHAKGIPYAERMRYLLDGTATFRRPTRIKEAARDGSRANVWRSVTKVRRRVIKASRGDGALAVPRIVRDRV